jgi:GTP pyrophosphokinase
VRWDLDAATKTLYPTQILVTTLNEPGALGVVATTIGENGANIDNLQFKPSGSDFREVRFDLQVFDIQHLNTIIAQLRDKPVVAKVERLSG